MPKSNVKSPFLICFPWLLHSIWFNTYIYIHTPNHFPTCSLIVYAKKNSAIVSKPTISFHQPSLVPAFSHPPWANWAPTAWPPPATSRPRPVRRAPPAHHRSRHRSCRISWRPKQCWRLGFPLWGIQVFMENPIEKWKKTNLPPWNL